jgi:hypothetical protein
MSMILSDTEKQAIWNDLEKLGETVRSLALRLISVGKQSKHWVEEKAKAKTDMDEAEARLKILEEEYKQIDAVGYELVGRLMELELEKEEDEK